MPGYLILVGGGHAYMVTMAHIGDFIKRGHRVTLVTPSPIFRASDVPIGDDGGLLVNDALQCVAHPEIFGGGDCITLASCPLARVGVYAVG